MPFFISKTVNFIFNAGTIARPQSFNATRKHGRLIKSFLQRFMHSAISISNETTLLFLECRSISKGKLLWVFVALLFLHGTIIQRPAIETGRCSCFHSSTLKAKSYKLFCQSCCCFLTGSSSAKFLFADMNDAVK